MLPKFARLRKAREFRAVFAVRPGAQGGRRDSAMRPRAWVLSTPIIVLHATPRRISSRAVSSAPVRFGFSISKKVSKRSHDRNRLKRRLSEVARKDVLPHYPGIACYDCVVVVRQGAVDASTVHLRQDLLSLLRRAGLHAAPVPEASPTAAGAGL